MNFDGYTPVPLERFEGMCEQDDPTSLPLGVSPLAKNVRFHLTSVGIRAGLQSRWGFVLPEASPVTGLVSLKAGGVADTKIPMAFNAAGGLYVESPAGGGHVNKVATPTVVPPSDASLQAGAAFKRGYLAFSDLKQAIGPNAVYSIQNGTLDALSGKLLGQAWQALTDYVVGEVVTPKSPIGGNGHSYRCTVAGTSAAGQPAFPTTEGGTVVDGTVTWKESTPLMAQAIPPPATPVVTRSAGTGSFAAGRDVYIVVTLVNPSGETDTSLAFKYVNTTLNDRFIVTSPTLALWIQHLALGYQVTGYNVYEADVATASPAPALSSYTKVNVAAVAIGTPTNVDTTGLGVAPPTTNTALIVPIGNICAGLRYLVVMFMNRNGYITGWTQAAAVAYNGGAAGYQLYVPYIPIGPPNTQARILAFTPAGQLNALAGNGISIAGPYFWIGPQTNPTTNPGYSDVPGGVTIADVVDGIQMTSTMINDNSSTTATFNFTDNYLKSTLNDVSSYARKIQVPPASDIYYSPTLRRMFYRVNDLPSGWYVSLQDDPESVFGDTGIVQVAENNGQNAIAVREFNGIVYLLKEGSGHVLNVSPDDPSLWDPVQQWGNDKNTASGPCGVRAVDVGATFMAYVDRRGLWIFTGGQPFNIGITMPLTWKSINWAYQHTIWVMVDDETREILIGVPTGDSQVPDTVIRVNYEESPTFEKPVHYSAFAGKEVSGGDVCKFSKDDIQANIAIRAERPLQNATPGIDKQTVQSQIIFASPNEDGVVSAAIPGALDDNGVGIDQRYQTACPKEMMRPTRLGGVQANVGGVGQGSVKVLSLRAKDPKDGGVVPGPGPLPQIAGTEIVLKKKWIGGVPYACGGKMTNERMRVEFTNNAQPGVGFDLQWLAIYGQPVASARKS